MPMQVNEREKNGKKKFRFVVDWFGSLVFLKYPFSVFTVTKSDISCLEMAARCANPNVLLTIKTEMRNNDPTRAVSVSMQQSGLNPCHILQLLCPYNLISLHLFYPL